MAAGLGEGEEKRPVTAGDGIGQTAEREVEEEGREDGVQTGEKGGKREMERGGEIHRGDGVEGGGGKMEE
jgi:hypothetical protein